jgi:tetratricopeptide (TPR) repeat protein
LGKGDAVALCTAGFGLVYVVGDLDDGIALNEQALTLNPNLAWAWMLSGWSKVWQGEPETAIEHAARAMRLSPQDSQMFAMRSAVSAAHFCEGRPDVALSWAESSMRDQPDFPIAVCIGAASAALLGKSAEAGRFLARLRQLKSSLRVGNISELLPFRRPEDAANWLTGFAAPVYPSQGRAETALTRW